MPACQISTFDGTPQAERERGASCINGFCRNEISTRRTALDCELANRLSSKGAGRRHRCMTSLLQPGQQFIPTVHRL